MNRRKGGGIGTYSTAVGGVALGADAGAGRGGSIAVGGVADKLASVGSRAEEDTVVDGSASGGTASRGVGNASTAGEDEAILAAD